MTSRLHLRLPIVVFLSWGCAVFTFPLGAHEAAKLPEIVVKDDSESSLPSKLDTGSILPTERLSKKRIEKKHAQTLSEAVAGETGIDTQTSCANCGSKRVTINGLRGEHTTILVDGVPLHSAVSSFYGVDAVPMAGVEAIEVTRGAGASLTAPEAIGGVLNIITETPTESFATVDLQGGNNSNWLFSGSVGEVLQGGKFRLFGAGQWAKQGFWDVDGNNVSDAPDFTNGGLLLKAQWDVGPSDGLEFRYAWQRVSILGGTVDGTRPSTFLPTVTTPNFENNDVSRAYLDTQNKIADVISLARHEGMARWRHRIGSASQLQLTSSAAWQNQDSIYFHGYDYSNRDFLTFEELRFSSPLAEDHILTVGIDGRYQAMNSSSEKLYTIKSLPPDDFRFASLGLFAQDTWALTENHELAIASRLDWLSVRWPFQNANSRNLSRVLVSPRLHWKWNHTSQWTSRFSYGRGYRAPLSFFESQHGLSEEGFTIGLTEIETAHSFGYAGHYLAKDWEFGAGIYGTLLQNVAYADEPQTELEPAVFRNSPDTFAVVASYVSMTYRPGNHWTLEASVEDFRLPDDFKRLLPVAITEQRARVLVEKNWGPWEAALACNIIGPRDLSRYRYDQHYRTWAEVEIPASGGLTENQVVERKNTQAPLYATLDLTIGYHPVPDIELSVSVLNLTNFTQTASGDSPLAWGQHGPNPNHFHLDNMHVWGPLRGRTFLVGLKARL
jgi:outer membrane receptor for ferrienterochelin and colicins